MNKSFFVFYIAVFLFTFGANVSHANTYPDNSCTDGPYNVVTGQLCSPYLENVTIGCKPGYNFSPITGRACNTPGDTVIIKEKKPDTTTIDDLFNKKLKIGSRGEDVKDVQEILKGSGFLEKKVKIDGVYGPNTAKAVKAYQQDNDLTPTGVFDDDTIRNMKAIAVKQLLKQQSVGPRDDSAPQNTDIDQEVNAKKLKKRIIQEILNKKEQEIKDDRSADEINAAELKSQSLKWRTNGQ